MAMLSISLEEATPKQALRSVAEELELSLDDLAAILQVRRCTIDSLLADETNLRIEHQPRYDALISVFRHVHETFSDLVEGYESVATIREWLNSKNHYLEDRTPRQALLEGDLGLVHAALVAIDSFAFS